MSKSITEQQSIPAEKLDAEVVPFLPTFEDRSPLDQNIREGAQRMLQAAIDADVDAFIDQHASRHDGNPPPRSGSDYAATTRSHSSSKDGASKTESRRKTPLRKRLRTQQLTIAPQNNYETGSCLNIGKCRRCN